MYNKEVAVELDTIESQVREQIILEADCMRKLIVC